MDIVSDFYRCPCLFMEFPSKKSLFIAFTRSLRSLSW